MTNGSVSAPVGKGVPPQTSRDQQPKKIPPESNKLLKAVASWVAYDDFSAMKKAIAAWRRSKKNSDATSQDDPSEKLHPLLARVTYDSDDETLLSDVRAILFSSLFSYMPQANLYSPKKMKNDARLIKALCEMGASVIAEYPGNDTPIKLALTKGRFDLVETMIQFSTAKASECNESGDTILHVLLKNYRDNLCENDNKQYLNIIDKCLSKRVNLNQRNKNGETPVLLTVKPHYAEILKKLKNRGADLNCRTTSGDNLLMLACKSLNHKSETFKSDLKWTEWLVQRGFDVNCKDNGGFTPLHYASRDRHLFGLVKVLVKAGADIHAVTREDTNPLHLATAEWNFEAMLYFIERGVEFNRRDLLHGLTLMLLVSNESTLEDTVEWLFSHGFDRSEESDWTLLHLAAAFGQVEIVEKLIERGVNVRRNDNVYQYTPLHLASISCEFATIPELREAGLTYRRIFENHYFFIKNCTHYGGDVGTFFELDVESTVLALLKAGSDVNAKDSSGRTALHYAARHNENDLIALLLRAGARVDDVDLDGLLPLHHSILSGNSRGMNCLLGFGADFNDIEHPSRNICEEVRKMGLFEPCVSYHLIKLIFAGLPINRTYKHYFAGIVNHENAGDTLEYWKDVDKLEKHMLTSTVSLLDWLRMNNWRRRCVYLDDLPPNVEDEYEHYGVVIQSIREQTVDRMSLMEPAKMAFQLLTDWKWPDLCVDYVLSFLGNRTLRVMIDAAE